MDLHHEGTTTTNGSSNTRVLETPPPTPAYDSTTLQQRIHREILGLGALADHLVLLQQRRMMMASGEQERDAGLGRADGVEEDSTMTMTMMTSSSSSSEEDEEEGKIESLISNTAMPVKQKPAATQPTQTQMIRVRLDEEYWVDLHPAQIEGYMKRKEASLQAVEERRANLEQLKEWMIRELQRDTTSHVLGTGDEETGGSGIEVERNPAPEPVPLGKKEARPISEEERLRLLSAITTGKTASVVVPPTGQHRSKLDSLNRLHRSSSSSSAFTPASTATSTSTATATVESKTDTSEQREEDQPAAAAAATLREINSALERLGTSMGEVLKLPPGLADGVADGDADADGEGRDGPATGTQVGDDGTVLNEEGLPFLDIREDLPRLIDDGETLEQTRSGTAVPISSSLPPPPPADDYWSDEAVERRRKLRERLFADAEDEDADEDEDESGEEGEDEHRAGSTASDDESDSEMRRPAPTVPVAFSPPAKIVEIESNPPPVPSPESMAQLNAAAKGIGKGKGKAGPTSSRKPGFMARSMAIDHSVVADEPNAEEVEEDPVVEPEPTIQKSDIPAVHGVNTSTTTTPNPLATKPAPEPLRGSETPGKASGRDTTVAQPERRKSVTFNPQTRVRLYEKGQVMSLGSPAAAAAVPPASSHPGSRVQLLPDEERAGQTVRPAVKPPLVGESGVKSRNQGAFSGFKRGFLDSKPAVKQPSIVGAPKSHETTAGKVVEKKPPTAPVQQSPPPPPPATTTTIESPEYQQPLAPAHDSPAKTGHKKQKSLFAQRKAESIEARSQLLNFRSFDPMPGGAGVGPAGPVGTGKEQVVAAAAVARPVKMAVVERVVAKPRAPSVPQSPVPPIPCKPSAQAFPVKVAGRKGRVGRGAESRPRSGQLTAVRDTIVERGLGVTPQASQAGKPKAADIVARIIPTNARTTPHLSLEPAPVVAPAAGGDESSSDSLSDFEYSDGEDAFDMDEALLAREAALAYHAKRSELGRKGLGGWTGGVGADGEVEWDTELVPMSAGMEGEAPRVGPVAFGERIIPRGMQGGIRFPVPSDTAADSSDEDEMDVDAPFPASISLAQVVPASENLAASIKIGKLENGNLVVQDTDDSDASDVEEEGLQDTATRDGMADEQCSARAQAAEERRQRRAMIDRLRSGDIAEMIREEREREEMLRSSGHGGYVEPPRGEPPTLDGGAPSAVSHREAEPVDTAQSQSTTAEETVKSVVEKQQRVEKDIIPPTALERANGGGGEEAPQPKKMSKFKAARLARG
ncbi:hypothetical protein QFC21_003077 [Naganishia friedmannii]|uniref:Uncharacterized protein n=1 Tax=Naganishia friedmannii TaxID=89922 RepID=A0ACC2VQQ1_9TREE|nr:hypothetical protein QFC21_003077 [Naganishia friedmannii]